MNKKFAGIGSRETPEQALKLLYNLSKYYCSLGYTLRSGGADGADKFCEKGCDAVNGKKEIFLPWKNFNDSNSSLYDIPEEAFKIAEYYHPAWGKLSQGAQKLISRNCQQVLGKNLNDPSDFILCWTVNGELKGGTAQALRIAIDKKIPIINLGYTI